jgi:hypothetical protein
MRRSKLDAGQSVKWARRIPAHNQANLVHSSKYHSAPNQRRENWNGSDCPGADELLRAGLEHDGYPSDHVG